MPSTYSNLKIQLMATGENSTTWGDVTNLNLGTALEEAIVGSADVTFASNNITLTLTDTNLSQPARNVHLRCTGTTGGSTRNLVVPSIEKPYIIQNGCADSIVVKTAAGTGITVPAGKTMWVYNNGVNVVDATSHLTSLTLGSALPVASGGTGGDTQATARSGIGATTLGGNMFTIPNPSAVTFPRFNADNTVSALNAADFRVAIGASGGGGTGTVTSVSGSGGTTGLTLTGGPITTSGTLTLGGTLAVTNGGTGASDAATARTNLDVPSRGGSGASGTWSISISGSAGSATTATTANALNASNSYTMAGLTVNGAITATGNVTAFFSSDIRFKENVHPIQNALGIVSAVGGKIFDWTDAYIADHGGEDGYFVRKRDFGVIAQDVQAVFPLAVRTREDGTLAVDYEKLVAVAFAAIAELKAEVEALKK